MSNISIFNFVEEKIKYIFNNNEKFHKWGADNETPNKFLNFYENIPEHQSAINFILSNVVKESIETLDFWTVQKIVLDYIIFGGFTVEIIKKRNGNYELNYIDISKVRYNPDKTKLGYSENWGNYKVDVKWMPISKNIDEVGIFIFKNPKSRYLYPTPHYNAAMLSLDTMYSITEYHNNNASNGFTPNVIINFNNGEPDAETKKQIENKIEDKFSGAKGKKFILSFNNSSETATTIEKLDNDNLDQKFETLQKFIQNQIIIVHQITSGQLIGIKPENTGFSKTEYEEAMEIFKNVVISNFIREIEFGFSTLFNKEIKMKED